MNNKEVLAILGIATMTLTGCASQSEVDSLNLQVTELNQQIESLQTTLDSEKKTINDATSKNTELEKQVEELQAQLENYESELEDAESVINSADDNITEMSINVTKYAHPEAVIYSKAEENEEYKISELEMNTECYVVSIFSDANNDTWSALGALKTTDEEGNITYQIIANAEKGEERTTNKNVDFFFKKMKTISVTDPETKEIKEIAIEELTDTQDIQVVYVRSSLLSSQKVKEQQKTSTEVKQEKKQQTQTGNGGGSTGGGGNWWDDPNITGGLIIGPGCETHASDSYVPNTGWH